MFCGDQNIKHSAFNSSQVLQSFFGDFRTQDCMAPVCFKVVQAPSQKVIYCWTITQNTVCLPHYNIPSALDAGLKACLGLPLELFGKPHQWHTLRIWIWTYQRGISIFKNNIYWTNTISSYFFKSGDHSSPLSMFSFSTNENMSSKTLPRGMLIQ